MHRLDHITVIAPTLDEGVLHVRQCLDLDIPFGTRHAYMGTHNHRLQLGDRVYLEIVAIDPEGAKPHRPRWFGLDHQERVRMDWDNGRRLRGWVASTPDMNATLSGRMETFGEHVALPPDEPEFSFSIAKDGSLPLGGAAPSWIDHRSTPTSMDEIPEMGARLKSFELTHPDPISVTKLYRELGIEHAPSVSPGSELRYRAEIETLNGLRILT
ncbi:VOC family protein [Aliiroseovarius sp. 2305UL8-7]|uniref:VOC family protein n=1 Tax=Aliiroseovarius conchicola TaxID=3121637 RepID=UPI003527F99F